MTTRAHYGFRPEDAQPILAAPLGTTFDELRRLGQQPKSYSDRRLKAPPTGSGSMRIERLDGKRGRGRG